MPDCKCLLFFLLLIYQIAYFQNNADEKTFLITADSALRKVAAICEKDIGQLWGTAYVCPIVIINRTDGKAVSTNTNLIKNSTKVGTNYYGNSDSAVMIVWTASIINGC